MWALIRQADQNSPGKIKEHPFQKLREMTTLNLGGCKLEGAFSIIRVYRQDCFCGAQFYEVTGIFPVGG